MGESREIKADKTKPEQVAKLKKKQQEVIDAIARLVIRADVTSCAVVVATSAGDVIAQGIVDPNDGLRIIKGAQEMIARTKRDMMRTIDKSEVEQADKDKARRMLERLNGHRRSIDSN